MRRDGAITCSAAPTSSLGYTIAAGDSEIGFVRGEKYLPRSERWFLPGNGERDILTATVFADPATGASSLRATASLRDDDDTGSPTKSTKSRTPDANAIVAACADQTALGA